MLSVNDTSVFSFFGSSCLGARDPIHQHNRSCESRKCHFNDIHNLYTYGHLLLKDLCLLRVI